METFLYAFRLSSSFQQIKYLWNIFKKWGEFLRDLQWRHITHWTKLRWAERFKEGTLCQTSCSVIFWTSYVVTWSFEFLSVGSTRTTTWRLSFKLWRWALLFNRSACEILNKNEASFCVISKEVTLQTEPNRNKESFSKKVRLCQSSASAVYWGDFSTWAKNTPLFMFVIQAAPHMPRFLLRTPTFYAPFVGCIHLKFTLYYFFCLFQFIFVARLRGF